MSKKIDIRNITINNNMEGKKKKQKCPICEKKLSLLDIKCKCGIQFCREHYLPEYHKCKLDISKEKNEQLQKEIVLIENDRIGCRI